MTTWVMFLRGINVGGHRKVPMADLRALCAKVTGDRKTRTYIASGNVVFRSDLRAEHLVAQIGGAIKAAFGFEVPLLVLEAAVLQKSLEECPQPDVQGNLMHAYLCYDDPVLDWARVAALKAETEDVTVVDRVVWLFAPDGIGRSKLAAKLEGLLGVEATARNLNTIRKMVAISDR